MTQNSIPYLESRASCRGQEDQGYGDKANEGGYRYPVGWSERGREEGGLSLTTNKTDQPPTP